jgi:transcription antitermination factor NusG
LVRGKSVTLIYSNLLDLLRIQEKLAIRWDWHPLCFVSMSKTERFRLRGSMQTSIGEATHLTEHGEALQQSSGSRKGYQDRVASKTPLARWYALQTYPRHEKRVHNDLTLRGIECFLPLYEGVHRWKNGCRVRVELPLFPGYLFIRIDPAERFKALSLPGAVSIVGSASGPWPLPDSEIVSLRTSLQSRKFEPHPYLAVGQKVRIKSGPLANLTGFLVRQSGGFRVVVSVELIRQAAAVEVDIDDVEAIGPASAILDT